MTRIQSYFKYIGKCRREISTLAKQTHCSQFYHWFDYVVSVLRHGTLIRQYTIGNFWKLSHAERKKRLTYPRMCKMMKRLNNPDYIRILNDKTQFNKCFNSFIKREWLYVSEAEEEQFINFLTKHRTIIVKPMDGVEGHDVRRITFSSDNEVNIHQLYTSLREDNVLIEECIIPHPNMVFNNTAVNTIRTHTIYGKDGKGHVVKAILRAGVGNTAADNYALGGSIYEVDVETGIIISYGKSKAGDVHLKHPGTNTIMLGYQIPRWEEVIDISIRAAEHIPQVGIIGWDVAIMNDGVQLIEGNHNPDYELFEFLGSTGYYEIFKNLIN